MTEESEATIALFKLYVETAEKVSDRRAAANTWMLSVNSAIIGFYGWVGEDNDSGVTEFWAVPAAGVLVCLAWAALLDSYRKLNRAKFRVLQEIERSFAHRAFTNERDYYKNERRRSLSSVERWIPWSFALLYALILVAGFM